MGFMDKVWTWLGMGGTEEEDIARLPFAEEKDAGRKPNLVSLQGAKSIRVVVCEPTTFEDAQDLADSLKNRRQVVINLNNTDTEVSRRLIDFLSGTAYALEGSTQKLGEGIFLFVPSNVEISREPKMQMRSTYAYSRNPTFGREE